MPMFHHAYVPPCLCSTTPMFHHAYVPPRLCSHSDDVPPCLFPACLCHNSPVFSGVYILACLCSTLFVCSMVSIFHRVYVPQLISVLRCLYSIVSSSTIGQCSMSILHRANVPQQLNVLWCLGSTLSMFHNSPVFSGVNVPLCLCFTIVQCLVVSMFHHFYFSQ